MSMKFFDIYEIARKMYSQDSLHSVCSFWSYFIARGKRY